jgi:hypothetical protein
LVVESASWKAKVNTFYPRVSLKIGWWCWEEVEDIGLYGRNILEGKKAHLPAASCPPRVCVCTVHVLAPPLFEIFKDDKAVILLLGYLLHILMHALCIISLAVFSHL